LGIGAAPELDFWIDPASLLFGPLAFAFAGAGLATFCRPRWGAFGALGFATAFLGSSQVGRILMYDVHPEALYPAMVFFWACAAGMGDGKLRPVLLLVATIGLMGIKKTRSGVTSLDRDRAFTRPQASSLSHQPDPQCFFALAMTALQLHAVKQWSSGAWGPHQWQGSTVILPSGAELMRGRHWDSLTSALSAAREIIDLQGGWSGAAGRFFRFSSLTTCPFIARCRALGSDPPCFLAECSSLFGRQFSS